MEAVEQGAIMYGEGLYVHLDLVSYPLIVQNGAFASLTEVAPEVECTCLYVDEQQVPARCDQ